MGRKKTFVLLYCSISNIFTNTFVSWLRKWHKFEEALTVVIKQKSAYYRLWHSVMCFVGSRCKCLIIIKGLELWHPASSLSWVKNRLTSVCSMTHQGKSQIYHMVLLKLGYCSFFPGLKLFPLPKKKKIDLQTFPSESTQIPQRTSPNYCQIYYRKGKTYNSQHITLQVGFTHEN